MSTRENDLIRELTANALDIVTGGTKNLHLSDITKAAGKAAQGASGGLESVLQGLVDVYADRL